MKKVLRYLVVMMVSVAMISCEETDPETEKDALENDEILENLEANLLPDEGGIMIEFAEAADYSSELLDENSDNASLKATNDICGLTGDSTINKTGARYQLGFTWNWQVVCDGFIPDEITFESEGTFQYNGSRLQNNSSNESQLRFQNLITGDYYTITGNASRNGNSNYSSATRGELSYSSNISFTNININIDKTDYTFGEGSMNYSMSGVLTDGSEYKAEGSITYNGDDTITILINGEEFIIEL